jgi:hypothetical protein
MPTLAPQRVLKSICIFKGEFAGGYHVDGFFFLSKRELDKIEEMVADTIDNHSRLGGGQSVIFF